MIRSSLILLALAVCTSGIGRPQPNRAFDEFGDIKCEDEMARLDNFALQLQNEPTSKALIVVYGGRRFRGRLPKQDETDARAARLKTYLVERRGISKDRIMVVNWGYLEDFVVQLWNIPYGSTIPERRTTIPINEIKFGKGKANPRDYRCGI
jgi:hypothetical protein